MENFIIEANNFLSRNVRGYYHSEYHGGGNWNVDGTIENIITTLKNDITPYNDEVLHIACNRLRNILLEDLPEIMSLTELTTITGCIIPRAKTTYNPNQLLFKDTVRNVINQLPGFVDGTDFIVRTANTRTTHRNKAGYGGDGPMPYVGITRDTCTISPNVNGKNILLIDDLYTKTINIDEDAIQSLFYKGARNIYFYAVGKTALRHKSTELDINKYIV
jgi:hypothetical protein